MISNKIKNVDDWMSEGKIKNTKYVKTSTPTSIEVTKRLAKTQGLFNDNLKTLKGFKELYDEYKNYGLLDVYERLEAIWYNTTNYNLSVIHNHLLAIAVYLDLDAAWLNEFSMCVKPFYRWFNDIGGVKRPSMNKDIVEMSYRYFKLYLLSLLNK